MVTQMPLVVLFSVAAGDPELPKALRPVLHLLLYSLLNSMAMVMSDSS